HSFRTKGDAEVIVHSHTEWGAACFERFEGMFAIAIWDGRVGRLLLARDRFGKKPLVYAVHRGRLCFASELKGILALAGVPREIEPQALHRYLLFQYVPAPHSVYRGFRKVPPGCCVRVENGEVSVPEPFWRVPTPQRFPGTYEQAQVRLGELLTRAVEKRLVADVPLGAFLSGGIDSSIVVALMRKLGVSPLRTFSIGFPDARYDETAYARRVAAHFETEHHEYTVTPRARDVLAKLAYHYDEPFADSSAIPTYYVSRWTRQAVTVALTGDAGDECFGGYDRYRAAQMAAGCDWLPRPIRRLAASLATILPHGRAKSLGNRAYRFLSALGQRPSRRYLSWINVFPPQRLRAGYLPEFVERLDFDEPLSWFDGLYESGPGAEPDRAIHTDFHSYLPYDLLTKVDIASMACSLECRSPFLDHELVEFALSLPLEWRLGARGGKHILKEWASDLLPTDILARGKMGFGVPVGEWFRGDLRDLLEERLFAREALCARIFRPEWLRDMADAHLSGRRNHEHPLWALLMLELWFERWRPGMG
ncbi:MAG: asparagine synthase (glutamine-hydrolyzing), partial [Planctomycetes bacterium]|nr:asparagine synthase (glutamine-hydrolyzing) [Planctomycetota bacterium]